MTDQDSLHDRLSKVVHAALCTWMNDPEAPGSVVEFAAQAVIDEFGLTKEWQPVSRQILNDGTAIENPTQSRIVGKWEPECHR